MSWSGRTRGGLLGIAAALSLGYALARFVTQGILTTWSLDLAWWGEQLPPLFAKLVDGRPIDQVNYRQYGVVTYLLLDPAIRVFGRDGLALNVWSLATQIPSVIAAIVLVGRRLFPDATLRTWLVLFAAWFGFGPIIFAVALRSADAWELFLVSSAFFLWTGTSKQRIFAAVPLAAATLVRLVPSITFGFVVLRSWRAGLIGVAAILVLLGVGQALYGPLMGFGYPFVILSGASGAILAVSTQQENNSVRGLLFKLAAGFQTGPSAGGVARTDMDQLLSTLAYGLSIGFFAYLLWVSYRGRHRSGLRWRSIEFSLAIITMLVASPQAPYEYFVVLLPVFTVLAALWRRDASEFRSMWLRAVATVAFLLIAVYLPASVLARIVPVVAIMGLAGNDPNIYGGPTLATYQFLGFPGLGLILTWVVLVVVERRMARSDERLKSGAP